MLCLMRSCGHQASAAINSRQLSIPAVSAAVSHSSSNSGSLACHIRNHARSPPTSPRHLLDPGDPELVRQLRTFLLRAAQHPAGSLGVHADELTDVLQNKLAVSTQEVEGLLASASSSSSKQQLQPQQLQELEAGLTSLLQLFSQQECVRLLQSQPALLFVPLASWCEFFVGYGFSSSQIKNLISQTRGEVMTKSDLVTAGERGDGAVCLLLLGAIRTSGIVCMCTATRCLALPLQQLVALLERVQFPTSCPCQAPVQVIDPCRADYASCTCAVLCCAVPEPAGDAIMHLKALGFDNDEIRHRVVAYCPQVRFSHCMAAGGGGVLHVLKEGGGCYKPGGGGEVSQHASGMAPIVEARGAGGGGCCSA